MSTFQKIATLIIRLFALLVIFYSVIAVITVGMSMSFQMILIACIPFVLGVVIYIMSFPLAYLVTRDFEK